MRRHPDSRRLQRGGPVDSAFFTRDTQGRILAYCTVDGSPLWGGNPTTIDSFDSELSSDGTRIFAVANCVLYALNPATGAELWHTEMLSAPSNCSDYALPAPIVVAGKVYATETWSKMVALASTGEPLLRFPAYGFNGGTSVVVGGVWMYLDDDRLTAVETTTGRRLWKSVQTYPVGVRLSATGDLVLAASTYGITGLSRLTGEQVWDGGTIQGVGGTAVLGVDRIFVTTETGVRAYGPL